MNVLGSSRPHSGNPARKALFPRGYTPTASLARILIIAHSRSLRMLVLQVRELSRMRILTDIAYATIFAMRGFRCSSGKGSLLKDLLCNKLDRWGTHGWVLAPRPKYIVRYLPIPICLPIYISRSVILAHGP